jgi:hypothetical protein
MNNVAFDLAPAVAALMWLATMGLLTLCLI